jgi:hypothetical protein
MPEGPFGFFPFQPSEEQLAEMREAREHHMMHVQDNTHAVKQMLNNLSADDLKALDMLLVTCFSEVNIGYFRGQITQLLEKKYEVCPCGVNHEEEFKTDQPKTESVSKDDRLIEGMPEDMKLPKDFATDYVTLPDNEVVEIGSPRFNKLLDLYNLTLTGDDTGRTFYRCICGVDYQSLPDRMLRPPGVEGCSGCQQRSAWG